MGFSVLPSTPKTRYFSECMEELKLIIGILVSRLNLFVRILTPSWILAYNVFRSTGDRQLILTRATKT